MDETRCAWKCKGVNECQASGGGGPGSCTGYGVTFDMFNTVEVRGGDAHPIFAYLGEQTASPYWNFYKYLVSSDGKVIQRFSSKVEPQSDELINAIEAQL